MNESNCVCGDPSDPLVTHRTDSPCYVTEPKNTPGRLKGGLSRFTHAVFGALTPADAVWAALGGVIGGAIGWVFVALWIR